MSPDKQIELIKKRIAVQAKIALSKIAKEVAVDIATTVRNRTQLEAQGTDGPLSSLEPSTVKQRTRYNENLSEYTEPRKSNATATGQLIDSIQGRSAGTRIIVEPNKSRRKGELSGSRSKLNNRDVLKWYELKGREFLKLSEEEKKDLKEFISERLSEELAKRLK